MKSPDFLKGSPVDQAADLAGFLVAGAASRTTGTEVFIDDAQSLLQG
jgi:hypothetical protein